MQGESKAYPGEVATPNDIRQLADEYRGVAHDLMGRGKRGNPSSWAPARMTAIQAIELYLNALLLARGVKPAEIRGYQHDLRKRTANPAVSALRLRQRTLFHTNIISGVTASGPHEPTRFTLRHLIAAPTRPKLSALRSRRRAPSERTSRSDHLRRSPARRVQEDEGWYGPTCTGSRRPGRCGRPRWR